MPMITIKTLKLSQEKKDILAEKLYAVTVATIGIPQIETYFDEYDGYYNNGKHCVEENQAISIEVKGPELPKEKVDELSKSIYQIVQDVLKDPNLKITLFSYELLHLDRFSINGTLLCDMVPPHQK